MDEKILTVTFNGKIKPIKPINEQLTLCKCYVMALGLNDNKNIISKEAAEDALPTLYNIPVVGHLYKDEDGKTRMGGHDMALVKTDDGTYAFSVLTVPYGVVPQQESVHYEEIEEGDKKLTYLVADIILWTGRYPELLEAIYSEDTYFSQSMEIIPSKQEKTKSGVNISKYQYSALCLLGKSDDDKNVTPCFKSSKVEPYKFSKEENWLALFSEFKKQLEQSYSVAYAEKGGKETLNETIKKILAEFELAEDTVLPFEVTEDMSEEDIRTKIKETFECKKKKKCDYQDKDTDDKSEENSKDNSESNEAKKSTEGEPDLKTKKEEFEATQPNGNEVKLVKFSIEMTYEEKRKALYSLVGALDVHTENLYKWYCLLDFNSKFVFVQYHFGGSEIQEESGTVRIPYVISDSNSILYIDQAEKVKLAWLTKEDEEKLSAEKTLLLELKQYKENKTEEEKRVLYSNTLLEFSDLGEIDEYKTIVKDVLKFENVEALKEKLYAIRGKNVEELTKKDVSQIKIPVGFQQKESVSEIDEFMNKYLAKK